MKTPNAQVYIIDTTLLDEVSLLIETYSQQIEAAEITFSWLTECPEEENIALDSLNETTTEFTGHIFRLIEIVGIGYADDLLFKEVRDNLLNLTDNDRMHSYMQAVVFPVGEKAKQLERQIQGIKNRSAFTDRHINDLWNQLESTLTKIGNDQLGQVEKDKLNEEAKTTVSWFTFQEGFYSWLGILSEALQKVMITTVPLKGDEELSLSPNLHIDNNARQNLYDALAPFVSEAHRPDLRQLLNGKAIGEPVIIKHNQGSIAYVFRQAIEAGHCNTDKTKVRDWLIFWFRVTDGSSMKHLTRGTVYDALTKDKKPAKANRIPYTP